MKYIGWSEGCLNNCCKAPYEEDIFLNKDLLVEWKPLSIRISDRSQWLIIFWTNHRFLHILENHNIKYTTVTFLQFVFYKYVCFKHSKNMDGWGLKHLSGRLYYMYHQHPLPSPINCVVINVSCMCSILDQILIGSWSTF